MRIYRCTKRYFSGLTNEPEPVYPWDYSEPEEMPQQGNGVEALEKAFHDCHAAGRDMNPGDIVALDNGQKFRCEMSDWSEWKEVGKTWEARIQQAPGRAK